MDRRWGGLLIIFVVVVTCVLLPGLVGRRIPGAAQAEPIPGPPRVGDCLSLPEDNGWQPGAQPNYDPQTLVPCAGSRFGEVVAVIQDKRLLGPVLPSIENPSDGSSLTSDPNELTCENATTGYVGLTVAADQSTTISSYWSPLSFLDTAPSGPTARQKGAGQTWVACVVFVTAGRGDSVSYPGTIKNTYILGTEPPAFAVCVDSLDLAAAQSVPCDQPHRVEAFGGTGTARKGLTQQSLDHSCRVLVSRLTGLADPTAGGRLMVRSSEIHGQSGVTVVGLGRPEDESGFAACEAVAPATHLLGATLLALGDRPIPWAP